MVGPREAFGIDLAMVENRRTPAEAIDPRVKNVNWMDLQRGLFEALDRGADTAVLCTPAGHLAEGPGFNLPPPTGALRRRPAPRPQQSAYPCPAGAVNFAPDRCAPDRLAHRIRIAAGCSDSGPPSGRIRSLDLSPGPTCMGGTAVLVDSPASVRD